MGSSPLVDKRFGSDGGAGVPDVDELGLVEPDECDDEPAALEPEDDSDRDIGLVGVGDAPELMSFALPHALEGGGLVGWFAVELAELLEQRQGDLLEGASSFLDGREPSIEVLRPVQNHLLTITSSDYNF